MHRSGLRSQLNLRLILLIVLVGLVLRTWQFTSRSLQFDEAIEWRISRFDWLDLIERSGRDNSPPLHFLVMKAWTVVFGDSVFAMRSVSVVLGLIVIAGVYWFAREAFAGKSTTIRADAETGLNPGDGGSGEADSYSPAQDFRSESETQRATDVALLSAALTATSVFQIAWARNARVMYVLGAALAVWSSWALVRSVGDSQQRFRGWLLYALLALAFAYTHYYAMFTLTAHAVFFLGWAAVRWRSSGSIRPLAGTIRNAVVAALLVVAGWLPWLPSFLYSRAQVQETFWTRPVNAWDVPHALGTMFLGPRAETPANSVCLVVAILTATALLCLLWKARTAGPWLAFSAAVGPFALAVGVSYFDTQVFHRRYLIFAHLFLLVALAAPVRFLPRIGRYAWAAWLVLNFLAIDVLYWQELNLKERPGVKAAMNWIEQERRPGEPVIVATPLYYFPVLYHARDRREIYVVTHERGVVHYHGSAALTPSDVIRYDQLKTIDAPRIWTVNSYGGGWGSHFVFLPGSRRRLESRSFPEAYVRMQGDVVVQLWINGDAARKGKDDESTADADASDD